MRLLFTCLVLLGLLAGLPGNVLAADPCETLVAMHMEEHGDHDHGPAHPCDPSHDQECPSEHHHHDACCHTMPLAAEEPAQSYMGGYGFTLMPVRSESLRVPDGPFADMDKPPLI
jgi:hypothetical protein